MTTKKTVIGDNLNNTVVPMAEEQVSRNLLTLQGKDVFKDVIAQYKDELASLIGEGVISEQTAVTLLKEAEYSFFQQIVKIEYK